MTKIDVIKAAFRAWGRELYRKTSLSQVARELGVTKPALYRHFKNKQGLLNEMHAYFFDKYAEAVRADYDRALRIEDRDERYLIISQSLARFYSRDTDIFIFSLIWVYGSRRADTTEQLARRGVGIRELLRPGEDTPDYPNLLQMVIVTVIFWIACFHQDCLGFPDSPSLIEARDEAIVDRAIAFVEQKLVAGLGLDRETAAALDFEGIEKRLGSPPEYSEDDRLIRAVGAVVAETGPWNASMNMVARRSGLAKSSLYSHFENKGEMLAQLFLTEVDRLIAYTVASQEKSSLAEERLYLAIIAAADYLRSRPEFLIAIDWLRLRNLNLGDHTPPRLCLMFQGVGLEAFGGDAPDSETEARAERVAQWVFFLIVNILLRWKAGEHTVTPSVEDISGVRNESFRRLYKFITLGMKGFDL
ncbi:MAG: TetR/AcrR family transcriptional regulator [Treponema sp.]|jgi:AcrR family transcriptional regulator|nr:TetR/AcrR family transcriptional regulator [Treponema sp.]